MYHSSCPILPWPPRDFNVIAESSSKVTSRLSPSHCLSRQQPCHLCLFPITSPLRSVHSIYQGRHPLQNQSLVPKCRGPLLEAASAECQAAPPGGDVRSAFLWGSRDAETGVFLLQLAAESYSAENQGRFKTSYRRNMLQREGPRRRRQRSTFLKLSLAAWGGRGEVLWAGSMPGAGWKS